MSASRPELPRSTRRLAFASERDWSVARCPTLKPSVRRVTDGRRRGLDQRAEPGQAAELALRHETELRCAIPFDESSRGRTVATASHGGRVVSARGLAAAALEAVPVVGGLSARMNHREDEDR